MVPARFALIALIAAVLLLSGCAANRPDESGPSSASAADSETALVKDLVCGMSVDPGSPQTLRTQYKDQPYYFCAEICKKKFEADPEQYLQKETAGMKTHEAHAHK